MSYTDSDVESTTTEWEQEAAGSVGAVAEFTQAIYDMSDEGVCMDYIYSRDHQDVLDLPPNHEIQSAKYSPSQSYKKMFDAFTGLGQAVHKDGQSIRPDASTGLVFKLTPNQRHDRHLSSALGEFWDQVHEFLEDESSDADDAGALDREVIVTSGGLRRMIYPGDGTQKITWELSQDQLTHFCMHVQPRGLLLAVRDLFSNVQKMHISRRDLRMLPPVPSQQLRERSFEWNEELSLYRKDTMIRWVGAERFLNRVNHVQGFVSEHRIRDSVLRSPQSMLNEALFYNHEIPHEDNSEMWMVLFFLAIAFLRHMSDDFKHTTEIVEDLELQMDLKDLKIRQLEARVKLLEKERSDRGDVIIIDDDE